MPRKPLVIFIEGLFREALKITKGFLNMGTVVKLLFKQLESRSALRAFPHFPHRPLVVAVISGNRLLFHALAVGEFIPAPLRSGNYVRTSLRTPTLHYAQHSCIHLSTPQHKYSFSHSIYSVPSVIPMPFFNPFPTVVFVPEAIKPRKNFMQ